MATSRSHKLSKASTMLGGRDLVQLGIPESPEYYYDAGVPFFYNKNERALAARVGTSQEKGLNYI